MRGISTDNEDQKEDAPDGKQYYDMLVRPRFTVKSGNVTAMYEMDTVVAYTAKGDTGEGGADDHTHAFSANTSGAGGNFGGDPRGVRTNRWIIDFAVPGSALRMRVGRSDWTSPDKEIFDSGGLTRAPGLSLYGKLTKNMSLSMFTIKRGGGNKATRPMTRMTIWWPSA